MEESVLGGDQVLAKRLITDDEGKGDNTEPLVDDCGDLLVRYFFIYSPWVRLKGFCNPGTISVE